MYSSKIYYGDTRVNIKELIEANQKGIIKLEYYGTKKVVQDEFVEYGIEVVKKEYKNSSFTQEVNNVNNIAENEKELEELVSILKRNKVTPVGLEDIISDLVRK